MKNPQHKALTAADLMQKHVVRIDADATIEEAAAALEDAGIGGAPVIDALGNPIGVISLRDLAPRARYAETKRDPTRPASDEGFRSEEEEEVPMADDYSPANSGRESARDCMSEGVVSVPRDLPIRDVAARMVQEKIHRVFVVREKEIVGVISTFDLARAIAEGRV